MQPTAAGIVQEFLGRSLAAADPLA